MEALKKFANQNGRRLSRKLWPMRAAIEVIQNYESQAPAGRIDGSAATSIVDLTHEAIENVKAEDKCPEWNQPKYNNNGDEIARLLPLLS
ncbi:hypothetical protein HPP92_000852 [Vanilla planifolia]|uniref:Uncharacterized protein n=1 Tax=Vanilla planifolia TaxID=51239 RepID=A0A835RQ00_VANPL|nr:hypothetical protein HPP92_000852 [Vanilla planifolia]